MARCFVIIPYRVQSSQFTVHGSRLNSKFDGVFEVEFSDEQEKAYAIQKKHQIPNYKLQTSTKRLFGTCLPFGA